MSLSRAKNFMMISLFLFVLVFTGSQRTSYAYYGWRPLRHERPLRHGWALWWWIIRRPLRWAWRIVWHVRNVWLKWPLWRLWWSLYGGLYGGLYGMYGGLYGSIYGMGGYNPFGLQNMYYTIQTGTGLSYQVPFLQIAPMLGMAGLYDSLFPSLFSSASSPAAEQAGTWSGIWTSGLVSGPVTLILFRIRSYWVYAVTSNCWGTPIWALWLPLRVRP